MAIFGFGKKNDKAVGDKDGKSARLNRAKQKASSHMKRHTTRSTAKRPGAVRRPNVLKPNTLQPSVASAVSPSSSSQASSASQRKIRTSTKGKQIGALLVKNSKITEEQLDKALAYKAKHDGLLGQILVAQGACSVTDIASALKKQRTITTVNLTVTKVCPEALALLDRTFCEKNRLIPFELVGTQLCVAMSNALDTTAKSEVKERTQMQTKIFDASNEDIQAAIKKHMEGGHVEAAPSLAEAAEQEAQPVEEDLVIELPEELDVEAPVRIEIPEADLADVNVPDISTPEIQFHDDEESVFAEEPAIAEEVVAEQEISAALTPAEPEETIHSGDIPSIPMELEVEESTLPAVEIPEGLLGAVPITDSYFDELVSKGTADPLVRWMAEHRNDDLMPIEMAII